MGGPAGFMVRLPLTALVGPANCSPKLVSLTISITRYLHGELSWVLSALQKRDRLGSCVWGEQHHGSLMSSRRNPFLLLLLNLGLTLNS